MTSIILLYFLHELETGCGKSTQLPLYLHEAGWTNEAYSVVCTQPRRIAATNVAARVAHELGCDLGQEVGYGVRFDFKCSPQTRIKYYTDGILLRETMSDPLLSRYSVVIIDEAHVRSLSTDILLGLLKKIQRKRKDLRVVVTSATLDAAPLKDFFEANESTDRSADTACIISLQGRQFPVEVLYSKRPVRDYIRSSVDAVLGIHGKGEWGDILVFLPGGEEIDRAIEMLLNEYDGGALLCLPLYSSLPPHIQQAVFQPTPPHKRKVVFATNIAEASITIDGICFVIDSGLVKMNYFDVKTGLDALITCPITKATAVQRAGRAGRTQPGVCYRLMTEEDYNDDLIIPPFPPSEMQRTDISAAVLQLKALGIDDILHFDFLSPPPVDSMIFSLELLYSLGAIDDKCTLTKIGAEMAEMPLDPRLSTALLRSFDFGCGDELLTIAAMCSVEYPFVAVHSKGSAGAEAKSKMLQDMKEFVTAYSDHLTLLNVYRSFQESGYNQSWCDSHGLQFRVLSRAKDIRKKLSLVLQKCRSDGVVVSSCGEDDVAIRKCLLSGYFSNVAKLNSDGTYHTLRANVSVVPHPTSVIARFNYLPEWVMYNEVHLSKSIQVTELTKIDPKWLVAIAPHYYSLTF